MSSSRPSATESDANGAAGQRRHYRWFAVCAVVLVFLVALRFAGPAAPESVSIVSRPAGTTDYEFATRYKEALEHKGLLVSLVATKGSTDNLQQLLAVEGEGFAFAMSGSEGELSDPGQAQRLFSLGSVSVDPLWIFVGADSAIDSVEDLEGLDVLLGPEGSKSRTLGRLLLGDHGVEVNEVAFESAADIHRGLISGEAEAGFFVGDPHAEGIGMLLSAPKLRPISLQLADAYVIRNAWLRAVTYPRGAFDPGRMVPSEDLQLIAGSANLVIERDTHPALVDLLLDIAAQEHGGAGAFWPRNTFPSPNGVSLTLDPVAERFYTEGPPRWRQLLPWRLATFLDRMTVVVVPVLTTILVVFQLIPGLLRFRVRISLTRFYRRLEAVEKALSSDGASAADLATELDALDRDSVDLWVPRSQVDAYFDFRQFLHDMRERMPRDRDGRDAARDT